MGQIVSTYRQSWVAPREWLEELARLTPEECRINSGGEVSPFESENWARAVMGGQVWCDYCGHPMYWKDNRWPLPSTWEGAGGFAAFLRTARMYFPFDFWSDKEGFVYPRSLRVWSETVPEGLVVNQRAPRTNRIFSSFALKMGEGWYFYSYAHPNGTGILPADYARFVTETLYPPPPPPIPPVLGGNLWLAIAGLALAGLAIAGFARREKE